MRAAETVDDWFHRTARDFRWNMHRPASDGGMLYAYCFLNYVSLLPKAKGRRIGFEGAGMTTLRDGKIAGHREVANVGPVFVEPGLPPERPAKILAKDGVHLDKLPEFGRRLAWMRPARTKGMSW